VASYFVILLTDDYSTNTWIFIYIKKAYIDSQVNDWESNPGGLTLPEMSTSICRLCVSNTPPWRRENFVTDYCSTEFWGQAGLLTKWTFVSLQYQHDATSFWNIITDIWLSEKLMRVTSRKITEHQALLQRLGIDPGGKPQESKYTFVGYVFPLHYRCLIDYSNIKYIM
jgi:hypothetical protein